MFPAFAGDNNHNYVKPCEQNRKERVLLFENVVENTPKVAEDLFKMRPFPSDVTFLESLANVIEALSNDDEKVRRF